MRDSRLPIRDSSLLSVLSGYSSGRNEFRKMHYDNDKRGYAILEIIASSRRALYDEDVTRRSLFTTLRFAGTQHFKHDDRGALRALAIHFTHN